MDLSSSALGIHSGILTGGNGNACVSRSGISTSTPIVTTCATAAITRVTGLRVRLEPRDSNNESSSMFDLLLKEPPRGETNLLACEAFRHRCLRFVPNGNVQPENR